MKKRFLKLYESALTALNHSGFLVGNIVKFKDNVLKHEFFKTQSDSILDAVKSLIDSGNTLRVTNVVNKYPAVGGAGNPDNIGPDYSIEVSEDTGGGRLGKGVLVPSSVLIKIDTTPNLEPVPDNRKYDNKIKIKPTEVKDEAEEVEFYSTARTRTSDLGNGKLSKGDRTLNNVNVSIPASPAEKHKDPASYTATYLPKA
jgi:hypothetical protein